MQEISENSKKNMLELMSRIPFNKGFEFSTGVRSEWERGGVQHASKSLQDFLMGEIILSYSLWVV